MLPIDLPGFQIYRVYYNADQLVIFASAISPQVCCPVCSCFSNRVHSYYVRKPKDLPSVLRTVQLHLQVRRFRCLNPSCPKQTFAERLPDLLPVYAQRTTRLSSALKELGIALSAQAAAHLAVKLKMPTSQDTILRTLKAIKLSELPTPRILGVDDFAFRKGKTYGTLLIDIEKRLPLDLLPDRTAQTLIKWLENHNDIDIVCRDRSTEYTRAITQALPKAIQVADRWHLMKNLSQSLYRLVNRHYPSLVKKAKTNKTLGTQIKWDPTLPTLRLRPDGTRSEQEAAQVTLTRRQKRYEQVIELTQQGKSQRQITHELGINRETVRQYLAAGAPPHKVSHSRTKPSILAPYYPYLEQRWQEGCTNAAQLRREIEAQGYKGSRQVVQLWVALRRKMSVAAMSGASPENSKSRLPGVKGLTWLLSREENDLNKADQIVLAFLKEEEELEKGWNLTQRFRELMKQRNISKFQTWLRDCLSSEIVDLVSFAQGLQRDQAAVEAGIGSRLSNGQTEGRVNKLKLIKRQLYGRGSFELLRQKVLLAG